MYPMPHCKLILFGLEAKNALTYGRQTVAQSIAVVLAKFSFGQARRLCVRAIENRFLSYVCIFLILERTFDDYRQRWQDNHKQRKTSRLGHLVCSQRRPDVRVMASIWIIGPVSSVAAVRAFNRRQAK